MKRMDKRLSKPAILHLSIFNLAFGILYIRNFDDVVSKAVRITQDTKELNRKHKLIKKAEEALTAITDLAQVVFKDLTVDDAKRIKNTHSMDIIKTIPEKTTNPEILGLYLLFLEFQDNVDPKLDDRLKPLAEVDYMSLILLISEDIGLESNVADDMFLLALELIKKVKR